MIIFEHSLPLFITILATAAALGVGLFSFWRYMPKNKSTIAITALYVLFLATLTWCILLPGCKEVETHTLKPRFIIAMDTSQSMLLSPTETVSNRWAVSKQALKLPWTDIVKADYDVETYTFSDEVGAKIPFDTVSKLKPDGSTTLLRDSVKNIASRYAGLNVEGMLLLTDGTDTREAYNNWASESRPFPIYTLKLEPEGLWKKEADVRVDSVNTPHRVTKNWDSKLKAIVSGQGTQNQPVGVQLYKEDRLIQELPAEIPNDGGSREVTFQLEHPETGTFRYRVCIPPLPDEATTNDNEYVVSVQVGDAKDRVLYVEGTPRWEYRYLRRALISNNDVTPMIFYTGFDGKPRAGVPVGTLTANMTASELTFIKIVILGNLGADELTEQRAENLAKFVNEGGSLVLLGGPKVWAANGLSSTALKNVLPVKGHGHVPLETGKPMPVQLTDIAKSHPAFAGDLAIWQSIPPILSVIPDVTPSPGASSLITAKTPRGPQAVVVTHRYGQGKVAAIFTDTLWKWKLASGASKGKYYDRFWAQLISWLMPTDEDIDTQTIDAFADKDRVFLGDDIEIKARLGDALASLDNMQCMITLPDERDVPYTMQSQYVTTPSGKSYPGFILRFNAETPGLHSAVAVAEHNGQTIKSEPVTFFVKPFTPESVPRPITTEVLKALATASGGQYFDSPDALNNCLSELQPTLIEDETEKYKTLWRHWSMIALLMLLMTGSWIIRKTKNMP